MKTEAAIILAVLIVYFSSILLVVLCAFISHRIGLHRASKNLGTPRVASVIGYKESFLTVSGDFISPEGLQHDHEAKTPGYSLDSSKNIADAISKRDHSNVILEVLHTGKVIDTIDNYYSRRQKVLQIIFRGCYVCNASPSYVFSKNSGFHGTCEKHATSSIIRMVEKISNSSRKLKAYGERATAEKGELPLYPDMYTFEELESMYPWIRENNIKISGVSGQRKFVPSIAR